MFPESSAIKSDHIILDRITYVHKLKDFTFIELPKFTKQSDELMSIREKWYYYLKHAPETTPETYTSLVADALALKRFYDELERFSWSAAELARYKQITKRNRDNAAAMRFQFQKGEQKGREEGIAIGAEATKHSMACQMLARGMHITLISELTGLSEGDHPEIVNSSLPRL